MIPKQQFIEQFGDQILGLLCHGFAEEWSAIFREEKGSPRYFELLGRAVAARQDRGRDMLGRIYDALAGDKANGEGKQPQRAASSNGAGKAEAQPPDRPGLAARK
jgi:hypothetical protein